jgi:tetratricopeptide (TPR) repeat protein
MGSGMKAALHWIFQANPLNRLVLTALLLAVLPAGAAPAETGQLDASESLFTVMAAINAVGYRADWSSPNNHPLRLDIYQHVTARNLPSLVAIKDFFDKHRKRSDTLELSQYVSFALSCSGPPAFDFRQRDVEIPPDVAGMREFSKMLAAFYQEANIHQLWVANQAVIEKYIAAYQAPVVNAIMQVNGYLRQMTSGFKNRRFQIFFELQAGPNQIQTRSYSDDYTIVISPSPEPRIFDIRHGYLHYLLDPMASRDQEILNRKKSLIDHALRAQALSDAYKEDYLLLVTESLIKAIEARLDHKPGVIAEALKEGYILAPYFSEALPVYEKQQSTMLVYYKDMVSAIDVYKEDKRLSSVDFSKEAAASKVVRGGEHTAAPEPEPDAAARTLEEAEDAYTVRNLEKAHELFEKVLQLSDKLPVHASAYYGLGRIAILQKNLDEAERLFQKSLESEPAPFDRGWDMVYLARLALAAGEKEQAGKLLNGVLQLEGATDKAKDQAHQLLQQISKQP